MSNRTVIATVLGCAAASFAPFSALASVSLVPGLAPVPLPGTSAAAEPDLGGVVVEDTLLPFRIVSAAGALLFEARLQARVVRSTATGHLHFYYRVRDTTPGLNGIVRSVLVRGFPVRVSRSTLADWRTDGLGDVGPAYGRRSTGIGEAILFDFPGAGDPLVGGRESKFFFVKTGNANLAPTGRARILLVTGEGVTLNVPAPAL